MYEHIFYQTNILPVRPIGYIQAIGLTGMGFYVCDKNRMEEFRPE